MRQEGREEVNVATKGHVLYCEDNEDTRILMMLERAGFKVTYGASVKECAEKAESGEHFDLYLLDHSFPDGSGLSLCEMLREHDQTTPILFCSGHALQEEKEAATRAGRRTTLSNLMTFPMWRHASKSGLMNLRRAARSEQKAVSRPCA